MHMRGRGETVVTQYPVSSMGTLFSPISNRAPALYLQVSSTPRFFTLRDQAQAVPLSQVLSQMRLFSLAPYFRRTVALTRSAPL